VVFNLPTVGGYFGGSVSSFGHVAAFLAAYAAPYSGFFFPGGELLLDVTDPGGELTGLPSSWGSPKVITIPIPNDPALIGYVFYVRAASYLGSPLALHCAYECTIT